LVESTSYDPWGKIKSGGTKSKFLYTGQENDAETGLHYYNARYYDSHIRRFTQPDDLIQDIYNPQTLNRYSYAQNNPLKYTDPSGHYNILDYNKALTQYYNKPSKQNYNNISKTIANIRNPSNDTSKAGPATKSSSNSGSGGSKVAGASANNQSSNVSKSTVSSRINILTIANFQREAANHKISNTPRGLYNGLWFINKVQPGGDWDIKKYDLTDEELQDFGNILYGTTGRIVGFSKYELHQGGGIVQRAQQNQDIEAHKSDPTHPIRPSHGNPLSDPYYGDDMRDYKNVSFGYTQIGDWY